MLLSACGNLSRAIDGPTAALRQSNGPQLAAGDRLRVDIFGETDLSGEYSINDRGYVAFPLIGDVRAAGMPVEAFRLNLVDALKNGFVRSPQVTVDVVSYQPISVIGEVRHAGQFDYRPGLSAQGAIALAGGYTYRANEGRVYVTRNGSTEEIEVDLNGEDNTKVLPGDSLRIAERYF